MAFLYPFGQKSGLVVPPETQTKVSKAGRERDSTAKVSPGYNYPLFPHGAMGSKMLFSVVLRMHLAVKRQNKEAVASVLSSPTLEISDGNLTD